MYAKGLRVSTGQHVNAGQAIGAVGNDGDSTGPHFHFETRTDDVAHDPLAFMADRAIRL
jgi:murein DD-endopeptidase MepM/ murein hydrolase activator NlpD